ncbi:MAG TPA: NAD(P)H-hydrate dehydratase [Vulgatibacter sp.]
MRILTAAEVRAVDREAIESYGIPGLLLMEHAAAAVAAAVERRLGPNGRACVVAGSGNNGGDGYATARLLLAGGVDAAVVAVTDPARLSGDAAENARMWQALGGAVLPLTPGALDEVGSGDVVVDSLLGTGLSRPPEGAFAFAVKEMNACRERGAAIVAVDLPSGLSADTGRPLGDVVNADCTVTFGALKLGLVLEPGRHLAGETIVAGISWPPWSLARLSPRLELLEEARVRRSLPVRRAASHKGTYGHCLIVAGSPGKSGAAALAGRGALRGGAGLVTVATRAEVIPQVLAHAMELMAAPLPGEGDLSRADVAALVEAASGKDVVLMGPGIPRGPETCAAIGEVLAGCETRFVLDADALNALAEEPGFIGRAKGEVVITPHPGEMARLAGTTIGEIQEDRVGSARRFAAAHGCTVILKGAGTVVADPDGNAAICPTGNAGMATAGSGDVLGGLVAALLAQGMTAGDAARAAVFMHGAAGDRLVVRKGMAGLVASDLLDGIAEIWASWSL